jgi:hypothetical protein
VFGTVGTLVVVAVIAAVSVAVWCCVVKRRNGREGLDTDVSLMDAPVARTGGYSEALT